MAKLGFRTVLLSTCLVMSACTSSATSSDATDVSDETNTTEVAESDPTPTDATTADEPPSTVEELADGPVVKGDSLPVAAERHREGEPTVGLVAPSLTYEGISVPSEKPTLLLVVVGSCADCSSAAKSLLALTQEFDVVPILIGPEDTSDIPAPWTVVADSEVARAFGGRDRPTAVVIGTDGTVLSRIRPFNRTGTEYDMEDLRFGLEIGQNQAASLEVADARTPFDDRRQGPLPDSFLGLASNGDAVQVDTASGEVLNRIAGLPIEDDEEIASQVFDEAVSIPGTDGFALSECCEPAAGLIALLDGWGGYNREESYDNGVMGWEVAPSVDGAHLAFSGYVRWIQETDSPADEPVTRVGASNGSNPDVAWLRDRLGVVYLHRGNSPATAEIIEFDSEYRPISRNSFSLDGPASAVEVNADGNLVVAVNPPGGSASLGQVYDSYNGQLLAEFGLEAGVFDLDYDVTGRFLAYVDGEGFARWQGGGDSGVLGEGFYSVSW